MGPTAMQKHIGDKLKHIKLAGKSEVQTEPCGYVDATHT